MKKSTYQQIICTVFPGAKNSDVSLVNKIKLLLFLLIAVNSLPAKAQNGYPSLTFHSPVLISGTPNQVNAVYLFPNVCNGVDANITIMGFYHGATLYNIDDTAGVGYYDAFQPYVGAPGNDSSFVDWKIDFKAAGTTRDTILPKLAVTGIDVDGDGTYLKELIVASTPGTFGLDPTTNLNYSFDGVRSTAISTVANFPLIDTNQRRAMFQMNFKNVSSILYRNGAVSTYGSEEIRQTCIYFKSFFSDELLLPVKLLSFNAVQDKESVVLNWSATSEKDLKYYSVQKSTDGNTWRNINNVPSGTKDKNDYSIIDFEKSATTVYYRLNQVAINGSNTYSKTIKVNFKQSIENNITLNTIITDNINIRILASQNDQYAFNVVSLSGKNISQTENKIYPGTNNLLVGLPANLSPGIYVLTIKNKSGQFLYNSKLIKN